MKRAMTVDDKRWEAEGDAETLARAAEIQASPARKKAASGAAKNMIKSESARLKGLQKVAKTKTTTKPRMTKKAAAANKMKSRYRK